MLEFATIARAAAPEDHCLVFVERDAVLSLQQPPAEFWTRAQVSQEFGPPALEVALGYWQGSPVYALQVSDQGVDPMRHIQGSLFTLLGRVHDAVFAVYGRALQMLAWRNDHRYCGRCGSVTALADGGRAMACSACAHSCYPRLSPCVIVAVTHGDSLLLAAAPGRRGNFYSTLAGFVEPGESAEEAVIREVKEEVGITVGNVRYFSSQPWPFPGQLMLGYYADYVSGEFKLDPVEIADAGWYTEDSLPPVPPPASIAGQLIGQFFNPSL